MRYCLYCYKLNSDLELFAHDECIKVGDIFTRKATLVCCNGEWFAV